MKVEAQVEVAAAPEVIWAVISDIDGAAGRISAIEKIEVLERPSGDGLVGLKWRETRKMFGKTATEVMWVTESETNCFYRTRAESHGCIYISEMSITRDGAGCVLQMGFGGEALGLVAKVMSGLMGWMVKGAMRKAIAKDLQDIKAAVEAA